MYRLSRYWNRIAQGKVGIETIHNEQEELGRSVIPPITDPLGRVWKQPKVSAIEIDDKHALMSMDTFGELMEYSCSQPSGVYVGKMWKSKIHDGWELRWFGDCDEEDHCSVNQRIIKLS